MDKDQFKINIKIDGKVYPLAINRNEEEKYRLAAKKLNETIEKFKTIFHGRDAKEVLSMSAFQIALERTELQMNSDTADLMDSLRDLNDDILDFLGEIK